MWYPILFIILLFLFVSTLNNESSLDIFTIEEKKKIKTKIKKTILWGIIGICSAALVYLSFEYPRLINAGLFLISLITSIVCLIMMIVVCAEAPSEASLKEASDKIRLRENIDAMNNFFEDHIFDKVLQHKKLEFCLESSMREIAIRTPSKGEFYVLPFEKIIDCEILEDGATVMQGGVGRAVVGGILAGGVGAIVGANTRSSKNECNSMIIRIIISDINDAMKMIDVITSRTSRESDEYLKAKMFAQEVYSTIISIIKNQKEGGSSSVYGEIERLAALRDRGIITTSEFQDKKEKLLTRV